ncbi:dynamin family protein [Solibacillus silvestris]|uniref:dynamin family protein n=1 Tax=Solibacillus silvestris TaxID=76853 RepID=UPI003F7FB313
MELMTADFSLQLQQLMNIAKKYEFNRELKKLEELQQDIDSNDYTIVVIGEFNHGKSSFVNALLGIPLLPTGIIPTTATINAIYYAEEPTIAVHYSNTEERVLPFSEHALTQFAANEIDDASKIEHIRIGMDAPLLKDEILIIDTPGLNDVNELRSEITYSFIPHADVVFFMLQMHKPLNRTEIEFLQNGLLKQGIDRIIFIANFVDQIDEEQIEEATQILTMRLKMALGLEEVFVYPISAKEALEAKMADDEELYALSNFGVVEQKLKDMCASGSRQQEKNRRYTIRLQQLKTQIAEQLVLLHNLCAEDASIHAQKLAQMKAWKESETARNGELTQYINEQQTIILMMMHKSIDYFFAGLARRIEEKMDLFQSGNIENFFERELPLFIKYQMKTWIETYTPQLQLLFAKLEHQISEALTTTYEQSVHIQQRHVQFEFDDMLQLDFEKGMDPTLKSGLIIGSASSVLLLTAPILVPVVAAFGMPFLSKKMQEKQIEEKMPVLKNEASQQMQALRKNFTFKMEQYVRKSIMQVADETTAMIQEQQQQVFEQMQKTEKLALQDEQQLKREIAQIEQFIQSLGGQLHVSAI